MTAIAPGWAVVVALVLLAVALLYAFLEGDEQEDTLRSMGFGDGHADPSHGPYDQELDALVPNERCTNPECRLELEQTHYDCQNHTRCLTECPRCGGKLEAI